MQLHLFPETPETPDLHSERQRYRDATLADQTLIGYRYDWSLFTRWCRQQKRPELPADADTLTLYLTDLLHQKQKVATVRRRYHAIAYYHRAHKLEFAARGEALELLTGAQRLRAEKPRRVRPVTIPDLRSISQLLLTKTTTAAKRDRAVLLVGFTSALRSVNLAGLALDDIEFCSEGMVLTIPREKQDQEARGRLIGIPSGKNETTCAVKALRDWMAVRPKVPHRTVFTGLSGMHARQPMGAGAVCGVVKRYVRSIGLDASYYGAHSLRAGFITAAGEAGLSDLLIAEQSGHRCMDTLREYLRRTHVFRSNACAALDL